MRVLHVTALEIARTFVGTSEVAGAGDNPLIMAMLQSVAGWPAHDEVPWCSSFPAFVCERLGLPKPADLDWSGAEWDGQSQALRARSWLLVGEPVEIEDAEPGFDLVVLKRGGGGQPGPEFIMAPGHVGFFVGFTDEGVLLLGGNQGNAINIRSYPADRILGIRRLT